VLQAGAFPPLDEMHRLKDLMTYDAIHPSSVGETNSCCAR